MKYLHEIERRSSRKIRADVNKKFRLQNISGIKWRRTFALLTGTGIWLKKLRRLYENKLNWWSFCRCESRKLAPHCFLLFQYFFSAVCFQFNLFLCQSGRETNWFDRQELGFFAATLMLFAGGCAWLTSSAFVEAAKVKVSASSPSNADKQTWQWPEALVKRNADCWRSGVAFFFALAGIFTILETASSVIVQHSSERVLFVRFTRPLTFQRRKLRSTFSRKSFKIKQFVKWLRWDSQVSENCFHNLQVEDHWWKVELKVFQPFKRFRTSRERRNAIFRLIQALFEIFMDSTSIWSYRPWN